MNNLLTCIKNDIDQFLKPYFSSFYSYHFETYENQLNLYVKEHEKSYSNCIVLRLFLNEEYNQIHISNIFIPMALKYNGIGKKMISLIYNRANEFEYDVFLVQMVDSFYDKILSRGAAQTDECDALQITEDTILT